MNCRFCEEKLNIELIDLVNSPASNSFLSERELHEPELFYPLKVMICGKCFLVQVDEHKKSSDIFSEDYAYFSSFSTSWLQHMQTFSSATINRFSLSSRSRVVEIASNDGYLLQYFQMMNIPVLGIEPTKNTAEVAIGKGIDTITEFFCVELATQLVNRNIQADLLCANNVLAHVPDINDFVKGMKVLLAQNGVITVEFPHLLQLIENTQFDTIYHEHFSYLSLFTVKQIFSKFDLDIFDVEEIPTHGGSLRIYAKHTEDYSKSISTNVKTVLQKELNKGINRIEYYDNFKTRARKIKFSFLSFLIDKQNLGKTVVGYGAAAKGNTLLNYCGIKNDLIKFVVDANPQKIGKYLPASHIPVVEENELRKLKPDFVVIFPWNISEEIITQINYIRDWGGQFVIINESINVF
jgi:hypothetical protein